MFSCAQIKLWAVVGPQTNCSQLGLFIKTLDMIAKQMSFDLPPPKMFVLFIYYLKHFMTTQLQNIL